MEIAALVLSILSLVMTIILTIWQTITTVKLNNINLKSQTCATIFDEFLIKNIPFARRALSFDAKDKLVGADKLKNVIVEMIKSSLYYKYNDKNFYDNLIKKLHELEDLLVKNHNKKVERENHNNLLNKIEELLEEIYKIIENKKIRG